MDEDTRKILRQWNLPDYIDVFKEDDVNAAEAKSIIAFEVLQLAAVKEGNKRGVHYSHYYCHGSTQYSFQPTREVLHVEWKYQGVIMYKCFLEIAYEAELNTDEDPELAELAAEICGEDPSTRHIAIAELRDMIYQRGQCKPDRTDDDYLLRFLRARDFIVPKAHRLLVRYCNFRKQYPSLYEGVDLWGLMKVKDAYEGTLTDRPEYGRISIFRFGTWDPNEFPVEDLVRAGMVMTEIGIRQPKMQVLGGTIIVDLEGLTLRHVATLTPNIAYQIVALCGVATPCRLKACHIINYSWILNTFFYLFKRFIPREFYDRIFFHGYDVKSLQQHIDLDCLPERYGGKDRSLTAFGTWLSKIKKYRTEELDKELKALGYVVKE